MRIIKAALSAVLLFSAPLFAGPYPGSVRDHGHSGSGDGGTIANLRLTTSLSAPQLRSVTSFDGIGISSTTTGLVFTSTATGNFGGINSINGSYIGGLKNRVPNGDMALDHQNSGGTVTFTAFTTTNTVDGWTLSIATGNAGTNESVNFSQGVISPSSYSLLNTISLTVNTAANAAAGQLFELRAIIPGSAIRDLAFGGVNASTITFSFYVNSNLAGTYGASLCNASLNRCYPFEYGVGTAGIWERKSITLAGDITGTWSTTDISTGIAVRFDLGSGSSFQGTANTWQAANANRVSGDVSWGANGAASFALTGVQLEAGSTTTAFEFRPAGIEAQLLATTAVGSAVEIATGAYTGSFSNSATTNQYTGLSTMTLTAGRWIVYGNVQSSLNGATMTRSRMAISIVPNNTTTDHLTGINDIDIAVPTAASNVGQTLAYPITLTATRAVYVKAAATFSAGQPQYLGYIWAVRR